VHVLSLIIWKNRLVILRQQSLLCVCMYVCMHIYSVSVRVCLCVCVCMYMWIVCVCVNIYVWVCVKKSICMYVRPRACKCENEMCMWIRSVMIYWCIYHFCHIAQNCYIYWCICDFLYIAEYVMICILMHSWFFYILQNMLYRILMYMWLWYYLLCTDNDQECAFIFLYMCVISRHTFCCACYIVHLLMTRNIWT